jgi:hypothetical protein
MSCLAAISIIHLKESMLKLDVYHYYIKNRRKKNQTGLNMKKKNHGKKNCITALPLGQFYLLI